MSAAGDRDDTKAPGPAANRRKRASDITGLLRLPISLFQSFRSPARTSSAKTPSNAEPAVAVANSKIDILLPGELLGSVIFRLLPRSECLLAIVMSR